MIRRLFTDHPASVGETYGEHAGMAFGFGWRMVLGGLACMVHAVIPGLFVRTGSAMITRLHGEMVTHRCRKAMAGDGLPQTADAAAIPAVHRQA